MILRLKIVRLLPLFFLLVFSSLQYVLLMRHKNPYMSDSYFYLHRSFEFLGMGYEEVRQKVLEMVDLRHADAMTINIFSNSEVYRTAHSFFTKRLFYPFLVSVLIRFGLPQNASMMIPVFFSFIGILIVAHACAKRLLGPLNAFIAMALFVAFSPTVEWATYFMTDVISGFFWIVHLFMIDRYLREPSRRNMIIFALLLTAALFNREQHVLMVPQLILFSLLLRRHRQSSKVRRGVFRLLILSFTVSISFILGWRFLHQSTLLDNLTYLHNSYGLLQRGYEPMELFRVHVTAVFTSHQALIVDLAHHRWWAVMFFLGIFEMIRTTVKAKVSHPIFSDMLLSSAMASYSSIFFFPVLSYRFFFPVVIAIIIFGLRLVERFFGVQGRFKRAVDSRGNPMRTF